MAHEFETGFFVKQPAWHGLGRVITEAPSIQDGLRLAGLDWKVSKEPIFLENTDHSIPGYYANVRCTDKRTLGIVKDGYCVLQNTEAFDFYEPLVKSGFLELEAAGSLKEGRVIWVLGKMKAHEEVIEGDTIESYLLLSNSHDGSRAVTVAFTSIRVVCQNTLSMAHRATEGDSLRVRHTTKVAIGLEEVRKIVDANDRTFKLTMEKYRRLQSRRMPIDGLVKYVQEVMKLSDEAVQGKRKPKALEEIENFYESGFGSDIKGVKGTMWGAYNAFTEWTDHSKGISSDRRLYNQWFGETRRLKDRALQVALTM